MAPQIIVHPEEILHKDRVWIFGYGSLIWHPNFKYSERKIGYVKGFVTRFWQGSIAHRGTPDKPGRVATMVEQHEGQAWGVAFMLEGTEQITQAFRHLNMRECVLGCYQVQQVPFVVLGAEDQPPITTLAFRATPENELFMGPDSAECAAKVVASSSGRTGHNAEYLFRLVDFMHQTVPDAKDRYLFELGAITRELLKCQCLHNSKARKSHKETNNLHKKPAEKTQYYHQCYLPCSLASSNSIEQRAS